MNVPPEFLHYARSSDGVFSRSEARAFGINDFALRMWHSSGLLTVLHRGVYQLGVSNLPPRAHVRAAVLAHAPEAAASHSTALVLHGCRAESSAIELTRPYGLGSLTKSAIVHRTRIWTPDHFTEIDGIPVTTPARTLIDLSGKVAVRELGARFDELQRLGAISADDLVACAQRFSVKWRGRTLPRIWRLIGARNDLVSLAESELERYAIELLAASNLPQPIAQYPLTLEGRSMRLDLAWVREKIAAEIDGWAHHRTPEQFDADHDRDLRLARAGWRSLRFTAYQLESELVRTLAPYLCA